MAVTMHDTTIYIANTRPYTGSHYTTFVLYCDKQGVVYKTAFSRGQPADYTMQAAGSVVADQQHPYAAAVRAYCAGDRTALDVIPHQSRTAMTPFQRAVYQRLATLVQPALLVPPAKITHCHCWCLATGWCQPRAALVIIFMAPLRRRHYCG